MRGRRGWVLLVLAAVFTMHGLQCAGAAGAAPPVGHGAGHVVADAGPGPVLQPAGPVAAMTASDHLTGSPMAAAVSAATAGVPFGTDHGSSPHGAGHLWALCLAVLAAGLAVLLLAPPRGSPAIGLPRLRRTVERAGDGLSPPGPPDLYSLCLMRT